MKMRASRVLAKLRWSEYLDKAIQTVSGKLLDAQELQKAKSMAYPEPQFLDLPKWDRMGWLK